MLRRWLCVWFVGFGSGLAGWWLVLGLLFCLGSIAWCGYVFYMDCSRLGAWFAGYRGYFAG